MRASRAVGRLLVLALGVALLATPAAAQSVNRAIIDELNTQLLYVALPLTLFVELTLLYAIYRFRDNDDPNPTVDDPALEITWTTATAVILVFVGLSGYVVMANPYVTPGAPTAPNPGEGDAGVDQALTVEVAAYQWGWEVRYPNSGVTTQNRVVIPADQDVRFVLKTEDVIHSFYIPELGVKRDIFPGERQVALTNATRTGEYRLHCAELCGRGHARMDGTVVVMEQSAFQEWVSSRSGGANASASQNATAGSSTATATTATG